MTNFDYKCTLKHLPELDKGFRPIVLSNREFIKAVEESEDQEMVKIAIERNDGLIYTTSTKVFGANSNKNMQNVIYIERLLKTLLWLKGGWKMIFAGPEYIWQNLQKSYAKGGKREFDTIFMSNIYGKEFTLETASYDSMPETKDNPKPKGRNLNGYRIGFDAGGSDRKVSAVIDGKTVFSEEVIWHPKLHKDPEYHYMGIMDSIRKAASKMPKVDAIGVSSAGIILDNQVKMGSLFIKVSPDDFEKKVKNIFIDVANELNVPIEVANDGDVTALAGSMSLNMNRVLGIAMGTSEAAGYVDINGNITGWLNELAFVPVDYNSEAMVDEWSGDIGCGVKYFSQDSVIKLAKNAGIELNEGLSPAEKLKVVQALMEKNDKRAEKIYDSIGCYLGYALAYYACFYDIDHVLLLGRVTSGKGGIILLNRAKDVLKDEFPELKLNLIIPDEKSRRVGQSVAAASLPDLS